MAVVEIDMVYDADGGLVGELRYVLGVLAGRHCGLCDVTHGRLRRRRSFDDLVCSLDVPVQVWHRNEQSPDVAEFTSGRTPTVVGRLDDGTLVELLDSAALDACGGDVEVFAVALDEALEGHATRPHVGGGPVTGVEP
jgi:hypothetical protein